MTIEQQIHQVINQLPGNVCDDCLTAQTNLKQRQVAFSRCTSLAEKGYIRRERGICDFCGKVKNVSSRLDYIPPPVALDASEVPSDYKQCWFWEGNVQSILASHLEVAGYSILNLADTAAREPGKDIEALAPDGKKLWVSVKGYPAQGNASRNTQARHWFAGALFDLVLYRDEDATVELAVAFPDGFRTYQVLARRTTWLQQATPFRFFWIDDRGHVREEAR